jgi:hypothetical protein
LSEVLLGPVRESLKGHRLLVVGDGMLHYIPFAAPPAGDGDELLLDHHEIVHLPSAAVMKALRQRAAERTPPSKTLAVVADAVYEIDDERLPPEERLAALGLDARPELVRGAL